MADKRSIIEASSLYEGTAPYIFISYSHRNTDNMMEICRMLKANGTRFWYDSGLHSGDDWNLVIATHLEKASVCLLLLSKDAASSLYVKNELNFAINHRIPIHVVLLENFILPVDLEMMLGRIQMVEMKNGYEARLIADLPSEVFDSEYETAEISGANIVHPFYQIGEELANRQGTISYRGIHKKLGYEVVVQADHNINIEESTAWEQAKLATSLSNPIFPQIYDVLINGAWMYTFQEYRGETFLDQYLKNHRLKENEIQSWINDIIKAVEYLFSKNLGFRDFARGSLVVTEDRRLGLTRLQNNYYGVIRLQPENRQYYFEKEVEEIAVLLYQLCTGEIPVLPFKIISDSTLNKNFIDKINLILQKSTREDHRISYNSFREILFDLNLNRISFKARGFLKKRKAKLNEYENIKRQNLTATFIGDEVRTDWGNLEEKFGFDETVFLNEPYSQDPGMALTSDNSNKKDVAVIIIRICSTGQLLEFSRNEIIIGRDPECDMVLKQPTLSRRHIRIMKRSADEYELTDLNSSNGTYVTSVGSRIPTGESVIVSKGANIQVGGIELQLC